MRTTQKNLLIEKVLFYFLDVRIPPLRISCCPALLSKILFLPQMGPEILSNLTNRLSDHPGHRLCLHGNISAQQH